MLLTVPVGPPGMSGHPFAPWPITAHQFQSRLPEATPEGAARTTKQGRPGKKDRFTLSPVRSRPKPWNVTPLLCCRPLRQRHTSPRPTSIPFPLINDGAPRYRFPHLPAAARRAVSRDDHLRRRREGPVDDAGPPGDYCLELLEPVQGRAEGRPDSRLDQVHEQDERRKEPDFFVLHGRCHGCAHRGRRQVYCSGWVFLDNKVGKIKTMDESQEYSSIAGRIWSDRSMTMRSLCGIRFWVSRLWC